MTNLNLVSFVGVDSSTNLQDIKNLVDANTNESFYLEFGVLYSETRQGTDPRYPLLKDINSITKFLYDELIYCSIHLCGYEAISKFLEKDAEVMDLVKYADRIQLNINLDKFDINELALEIANLSIDSNIKLKNIIIQVNKSKKPLIDLIKKFRVLYSNINFLYDASGGYGRTIEIIQPVDEEYYTGYAGGINPDNVVNIVKKIDAVNDKSYYIDMESGIRTNDIFDIKKCIKIVQSLHEII